jgi:hypothetical protein
MTMMLYVFQLPDDVRDFIYEALGKSASKHIITHCRRDLFQAVWDILLDDDFIMAWKHGIVARCADRIEWRFYPRIISYTADYPEK